VLAQRGPRRTSIARAASISVAFALLASACSGSEGDKAGGDSGERPVVLTLANTDPDPANIDSADFVAAVERISGGKIRIEAKFGWRSSETTERAEESAVDDVRGGRIDLAVIPARVWDRLGVTSFRALLAPFLVDSLALEQRVVASPLARRMLEGVEPLGLVGIAVIPGELRYPLGISRPLIGATDYIGATIGMRTAPSAEATFRALGASPITYDSGSISGLDGAELGVVTIAYNRYQKLARALTANVVFWPRAMTVVMNPHVFDALTTGQRDVLRRAGLEAAGSVVARIQHDTETWLNSVCRGSEFALVRASTSERATLRRAVGPLYHELERDPLTRELIAKIRQLRRDGPTLDIDTVRCTTQAAGANADALALQGRWKATLTREELRLSGASPGLADALRGSWTIEFEHGRFEIRREEGGGGTGAYAVDGHTIRFVWDTGVAVQQGEVFVSRWSMYRDRLSFSPVPGRTKMAGLDVEPFIRVR
jgi:TRAP-type C4-dicarboxylate transport system substrate-binding protein